MLVVTPSTAVSASARSSARSAAGRSSPCAMTLASIGSYSLPTTMPARQAGIHPDTGPVRLDEVEHVAAGGQEAARGILGVDAGLDGVARAW